MMILFTIIFLALMFYYLYNSGNTVALSTKKIFDGKKNSTVENVLYPSWPFLTYIRTSYGDSSFLVCKTGIETQ